MANTSRQTRFNRRDFLRMTAVSSALLVGGYVLGQKRHPNVVTLRESRLLMGTIINLALVTNDAAQGQQALAATFAEMGRLISIFGHRQPESPLAQLNRSGQLTAPPSELVELVKLAITYGDVSDGAFDISVKPLVDAYEAGDAAALAKQSLVDYRQIDVNNDRLSLRKPGMALTLDGIAKGRVVDGGTAVLRAQGFSNILVEAGGDLLGYGLRADERPWHVGITHPRQAQTNAILATLPISNQAVATSGDYQHSFRQDWSLHHILDPRTGLSPTDLASVTVMAPTATDADALSTTLMVLGSDAGLTLVESLPHVEALLVLKTMEQRRSTGFPTPIEA